MICKTIIGLPPSIHPVDARVIIVNIIEASSLGTLRTRHVQKHGKPSVGHRSAVNGKTRELYSVRGPFVLGTSIASHYKRPRGNGDHGRARPLSIDHGIAYEYNSNGLEEFWAFKDCFRRIHIFRSAPMQKQYFHRQKKRPELTKPQI